MFLGSLLLLLFVTRETAYTGSSCKRCGGLGLVCGGAVADVCCCSMHGGLSISHLLRVSVYTCVVVSFVFGLLGKLNSVKSYSVLI